MSNRNKLIAGFYKFKGINGSFLTKDNRKSIYRMFSWVMYYCGFKLTHPGQIGGRHILTYVNYRLKIGIKIRSLKNEMSAIRHALRQVGKRSLAEDPNYSNAALGLVCKDRSSNIHQPCSHEELQRLLNSCIKLKRECFIHLISIQRILGLRANEAVRTEAHVLRRWIDKLEKGENFVDVWEGTKGSRERNVDVFDPDSALAIFRLAEAFAMKNGGWLVVCANGKRPTGLKQAMRVYSKFLQNLKFRSHDLRYAFADEAYHQFIAKGLSKAEPLVHLSRALGHGDKRESFIKRTYLRHLFPKTSKK